MGILNIFEAATVIPVLEVSAIGQAAPLAAALHAGGLRVAEVTLRTDCALEAIAEMKKTAPSLIIGMGTIRTATGISASLDAGADFLVTPGTPLELLDALAKSGAPALPGVATLSEIMTAHAAGFDAMKFFPAEAAGGIDFLKAVAGPLPRAVMCPTGGVSADRTPDYLALPNVACVGGSWIAPKSLIAKGDWAAIEANARRAAAFK